MKYGIVMIVLFGIALANTGCLVSEDNSIPAPARLRLINTVPEQTYSLLGNDEALAANIPFDSVTPYGYAFPGFYNMSLVDTKSNKSILAKQLIQSDLRYSFYVIPDSASTAGNIKGFKLSLVNDTKRQQIKDTFYIRFLHFSPKQSSDATTPTQLFLKTYRERGTSNLFDSTIQNNFTRRSFNDISVRTQYASFEKLEEGNYKFGFFDGNDSSRQYETTKKYFSANKYYTLYLVGFKNGTGIYAWKVNIDSVNNTF